MLCLQRLNQDSTWLLTINNRRILIDPWLTGNEISGFSWFSEQWHIHEPFDFFSTEEPIDFILISQVYEDHCHLQTLKKLSSKIPIIAVDAAFKKLQRIFPDRNIISLKESGTKHTIDSLSFISFFSTQLFSPNFNALYISDERGNNILYAPHGLQTDFSSFKDLKVKYLLSTTTTFALPAFLGGLVNPGISHCIELIRFFKPAYFINTHDEKKGKKGLVARLAKVDYTEKISEYIPEGTTYISIPDYHPVNLPDSLSI